jgi:hypothetical protein
LLSVVGDALGNFNYGSVVEVEFEDVDFIDAVDDKGDTFFGKYLRNC